jgi:homoserine dehydrogenase
MNKVALCGYGTVGVGVKELLDQDPEAQIVKVLDLPTKKEELGSLLVTDWHEIVNDPEIDTVIECLGGDKLPHDLILASLLAGKNVISSNKETISLHLEEYLQAAEKGHGTLQFEASCGGGIPLLNPLYVVSRHDEITSMKGILNGTCNFILSVMDIDMEDLEEAVKDAQKAGFAEKDPTADLEGLDLVRKANILASLVYDGLFLNEEIPHFGIANLNSEILDSLNDTCKCPHFVVDIQKKNGQYSLFVMPELFFPGDPLCEVKSVMNGVTAECVQNGPLAFIGKGAGRYPTAAAICQDFTRVKTHTVLTPSSKRVLYHNHPDFHGTFYGFDEKNKRHKIVDPDLKTLQSFRFVIKDN